MIKFFRKIRQDLLSGGKTGKYLKYAIGEIILVIIGILIALQINNWNEENKLRKEEKQIYEGLYTNLEKDSAQIVKIINYLDKSLAAQNKIINSSAAKIINTMSEEETSRMMLELYEGAYSFFANDGYYNSLINNNRIDILTSESIKSKLIDLYDYKLERYEFMDQVIDDKFQNTLFPFLQREIGFYVDSEFEYNTIEYIVFQENMMTFNIIVKTLVQ